MHTGCQLHMLSRPSLAARRHMTTYLTFTHGSLTWPGSFGESLRVTMSSMAICRRASLVCTGSKMAR